MLYFADVESFLEESDIAPSYRGKLMAILKDPQKKSLLQVELAVVIDVGTFCESNLPTRRRWPIGFFLVLRFF